MIISVEDLKNYTELANKSDDELLLMQNGIEELVRKYTNNNFQNRNIRVVCSIINGNLDTEITHLNVGDTVQISNSKYNDGLYIVNNLENGVILDKTLYDEENILITKVEYPTAIKMGVINLLKWEATHRDKIGIQSESLSRHSVTYYNQDSSNQVLGYPVSLLGFLKPYMKARF